MGAVKEFYIEETDNAREAAYNQIQDALNDLFSLGVVESVILLTVCAIYNESKKAKEEENKQCKAT